MRFICNCTGKSTSQRLYWDDHRKQFVTADGKPPQLLNPRIELNQVSAYIEDGIKDVLRGNPGDLDTLKQNLGDGGCVLRIVKQFTILAQKKGYDNVVLVCSNHFGIKKMKRYDWIKTFEEPGLRLYHTV